LIEWRSDIGKNAIQVVTNYLVKEEIDSAAAPQAAEYLLANNRFVYAKPDEEVSVSFTV
jgi:hypothetical protein